MCSWSTIKGERKKLKNPFDECRKRLKDSCGVICLWTFNLFLFGNGSQCYQQEMKESLNRAKCFQDRMHLWHFAQKFPPERPENYCSLNSTTNEPETFQRWFVLWNLWMGSIYLCTQWPIKANCASIDRRTSKTTTMKITILEFDTNGRRSSRCTDAICIKIAHILDFFANLGEEGWVWICH